jgi:hypothetical protein
MIRASKLISAVAFLATLSAAGAARAEDANNRLMVVSGNSGHVLYDDGRDDLFCATRRHVVGYDEYGHRVFRRTMRCR